ncbi:MAG: AarF/ABC1/UbiB kinase family protein [Deltaproteobacteria bacterium]|nr:AarF/ABC1/UbiB kinase family protein [Deltaproteobacteria bacterium]
MSSRLLRLAVLPLRALQLFVMGLLFGLVLGFGRLGILFLPGKERRRAAAGRLKGRVMRFAMPLFGPTFIKLGQVLSSRPDLFPPEFIQEMRKLQDAVPPFGFRAVRRTVERDLGRPLGELFADFEEQSLAAGSVAQVHRAHLKDGTPVAVKVLRPAIRFRVELDASLLLGAAHLMNLHPKMKHGDPLGHMRQFMQAILDQTDLRAEVRNYERFRANFDGMPEVLFPKVYPELSSPRVLTLEFLTGERVDRLESHNPQRIGTILHRAFLKMVFEDGFVHADLHPGNLLVTERGEVAIFDVGLITELNEPVLLQLFDFYKCLISGAQAEWTSHLRKYHGYLTERRVDVTEALSRDLAGFSDTFRLASLAELEMNKVAERLLGVLSQHRMRAFSEVAVVVVGMSTNEGILKMLRPDVNVFAELAIYVMPIAQQKGLLENPVDLRRLGLAQEHDADPEPRN